MLVSAAGHSLFVCLPALIVHTQQEVLFMCIQPKDVLGSLPDLPLQFSCISADLQRQVRHVVKDSFGQVVHKQHLLLALYPMPLSAPAPKAIPQYQSWYLQPVMPFVRAHALSVHTQQAVLFVGL